MASLVSDLKSQLRAGEPARESRARGRCQGRALEVHEGLGLSVAHGAAPRPLENRPMAYPLSGRLKKGKGCAPLRSVGQGEKKLVTRPQQLVNNCQRLWSAWQLLRTARCMATAVPGNGRWPTVAVTPSPAAPPPTPSAVREKQKQECALGHPPGSLEDSSRFAVWAHCVGQTHQRLTRQEHNSADGRGGGGGGCTARPISRSSRFRHRLVGVDGALNVPNGVVVHFGGFLLGGRGGGVCGCDILMCEGGGGGDNLMRIVLSTWHRSGWAAGCCRCTRGAGLPIG